MQSQVYAGTYFHDDNAWIYLIMRHALAARSSGRQGQSSGSVRGKRPFMDITTTEEQDGGHDQHAHEEPSMDHGTQPIEQHAHDEPFMSDGTQPMQQWPAPVPEVQVAIHALAAGTVPWLRASIVQGQTFAISIEDKLLCMADFDCERLTCTTTPVLVSVSPACESM